MNGWPWRKVPLHKGTAIEAQTEGHIKVSDVVVPVIVLDNHALAEGASQGPTGHGLVDDDGAVTEANSGLIAADGTIAIGAGGTADGGGTLAATTLVAADAALKYRARSVQVNVSATSAGGVVQVTNGNVFATFRTDVAQTFGPITVNREGVGNTALTFSGTSLGAATVVTAQVGYQAEAV